VIILPEIKTADSNFAECHQALFCVLHTWALVRGYLECKKKQYNYVFTHRQIEV